MKTGHSRHAWSAAGLAALLVAGSLAWRAAGEPPAAPSAARETAAGATPAAARPPQAPGAAAPTGAPVPARPVAPGGPGAALPLLDTPPAELVALLRPRAEAGDAAAACRLALELLDCGLVEALSPEHARPPADDPHPPAVPAALRERAAQCRSLDPDLRRQAVRWLEQAARAGVPEAQLRYGAGQQYAGFPDGMFADPAFARWREAAPAMLERAFADGHPQAVELLRRAYADDASLFAGLVADDPERAYAYALLQARLQGEAEPATGLEAAAVARARRRAADWLAGPFAAAGTGARDDGLGPLWQRRGDPDAMPPCADGGVGGP